MKLFIRDHISFLLLFCTFILVLPWLLEKLDSFNHNYSYFIFLSLSSLFVFLLGRYLTHRNLYQRIQRTTLQSEEDLIVGNNVVHSKLEEQYLLQLKNYYVLLKETQYNYEEQANTQNALVSNMIHQIKTPLAVMNLSLQKVEMMEVEMDEFLFTSLKKELASIDFSLNQMLTYNRSKQLLSDLTIQQVSLNKIVKEVVNDLKEYFIQAKIFPKVRINENITIYTDQKWLKISIYQILSNAIKYGYEQTSIEITFTNEVLTIVNIGPTISESDLPRVFELFYTGKIGRESGESTGIGLYLVSEILTKLDHPFKLFSLNNETTFEITFSGKSNTKK